jgi:hypothetical protein
VAGDRGLGRSHGGLRGARARRWAGDQRVRRRPVYNLPAARAEAGHLLGLVRLPPGARLSVPEPAGAGAALSSYAVNVPVVPYLVDRHEFFVAAGTPASVIGWMEGHRPARSSQDDPRRPWAGS